MIETGGIISHLIGYINITSLHRVLIDEYVKVVPGVYTSLRVCGISLGRNVIISQEVTEHTNSLNCMTVTSEGDRLLVGSQDGNISLWDLKSLSRSSRLVNDPQGDLMCTSLCMIPSGQVACGLYNPKSSFPDNLCLIKFWNLATMQCERTIHLSDAYVVMSLSMDRNDRLISVNSGHASTACSIQAWDIHTGLCLRTIISVMDPWYAVTFLNEDIVIANGPKMKQIKLWETSSGNCLVTLNTKYDFIASLCSLSGGRFASGSSNSARSSAIEIWSPVEQSPTFVCERTFWAENGSVYSILQLVDGRLASCYADGSIKVWTTKHEKGIETWNAKTVHVHTRSVFCFKLHPDPKCPRIISAGCDQTICLSAV